MSPPPLLQKKKELTASIGYSLSIKNTSPRRAICPLVDNVSANRPLREEDERCLDHVLFFIHDDRIVDVKSLERTQ
jgi:hypothetical protein